MRSIEPGLEEDRDATLMRTSSPERSTAYGSRVLARLDLWAMQPLRAHVRHGRLVLDEPTDLPEGEEVELLRVDDVLTAGGDGLDEEERARLHASLKRGLEDVKQGRTVDARQVLQRLRARAASR